LRRDNEVVILRGLAGFPVGRRKALLELLRTGKIERTILKKDTNGRFTLKKETNDPGRFTVIGTMVKKTDCSPDLRDCFSLVLSLQPYTVESLQQIAARIAAEAHLDIAPEARRLIAVNSGGRPHNVESLIQRITRAVQKQQITLEDTVQAFHAFGMNVHTSEHPASSPHLGEMSGVEFEQTVTELLTRMGFRAEMTKATGDGGIDIVAVLDKPIVGGKYLFQCKRYAADNMIGAAIVREFYGAVAAEGAAKGILITTSDFTPQAREFAERVGIELIDFVRLQELLSQLETGRGASG
jgi:HJR/Mrr/RecB family endonuclease